MSEQRAGIGYYLVLAIFTAAAFAGGWLLRGRSEVRVTEEAFLHDSVMDAAFAVDVLRATEARDSEATTKVALLRLRQALTLADAAVADGVRVSSVLEAEEARKAATLVANHAKRELDDDLADQAERVRKGLRGE